MKQNWQIKPFEDCIEHIKYTSKVQSKDYKSSGKYPIVSQEDELISGYWDREEDVFKVTKPLIIFGDHTRVIKYVDFNFVLGADGVKIIQPKDFINTKFFMYFLKSANIKNLGYARHYRLLKNLEIPLPPLADQRRIVAILDAKFVQIDALKAAAQKNLDNAEQLWKAQFEKQFDNQKWEKKKLMGICTHIVDCPHTTPKKSPIPTEYPCIRTSELKNGSIEWSSMQYLEKDEYLKRITRLEPKENDIVYGREGTFGDAVLLPNTHHFSLGQRTMLFRPNPTLVIPRFLLLAIISPFVYKQAVEKNTGCGVAHVNVADVKNYEIPIPTLAEQERIVKELDALSAKINTLKANYRRQIECCDELRQSLLKKAFEGEL